MYAAKGASGALVGLCGTDGTRFNFNYRLKLKDPENIRDSVNKPALRKMMKAMKEHDKEWHQDK